MNCDVISTTYEQNFEVTDLLIGKGGFGNVFIGSVKGEEIAVKEIPKSKQATRELKALMHAQVHKNVITLLGYKDTQCHLLIAMEKSTTDLYNLIVEAPLDEEHCIRCFRQMLHGISFIHSKRIVHRDIKLENWVLCGRAYTPKLIDFGLAHCFSTKECSILNTFVGSKAYCCPRIIKRIPYDGFKCDVWSMGVCLFSMVAGFFPYEVASDEDWRFKKTFGKSTSIAESIFELYDRKWPHSQMLASTLHCMIGIPSNITPSIHEISEQDLFSTTPI